MSDRKTSLIAVAGVLALCVFSLAVGAEIKVDTDSSLVSLEHLEKRKTEMVNKKIYGNYDLEVRFKAECIEAEILISADDNSFTRTGFLTIKQGSVKIGRDFDGEIDIWKIFDGPGAAPWDVRVLKKGNFFRFWVNGKDYWIHSPRGYWDDEIDDKYQEPMDGFVGIKVDKEKIESATVKTLGWLQELGKPVIPLGKPGSWNAKQLLPGGVVKVDDIYYMYFTGSNPDLLSDPPEGAKIGVAYSKDLINWTVYPDPVIRQGNHQTWEELAIYSNGAVITPDGKIAIVYAGQFGTQKAPTWGGFGLAFSDDPLGPFTKSEANPVYKHEHVSAHEFDLIRTDDPHRRYIMFYAGFNPNPPSGPSGDRGYLIYSNDLIDWKADERNPVFHPETMDNWDAVHIRPRSLNRLGDMWFLWYEGSNNWKPTTKPDYHGWFDTVGIARSKDLIKWEYYSRNPALPGLGNSTRQFDNRWVGWPRMVVKNSIGYVFYTGGDGHSIGVRKIAIDKLTDWESDIDKTINLLKD